MQNSKKFEKEITFRKLEGNHIICNVQWSTFKLNTIDTRKGIKVKLDENNAELLKKAKALKGIRKVTVIIEGAFPVDKLLKNAKIVDIVDREELKERITYLF